ncbi:hypothetical protein ACIQW4_01180 [Streptomyces albogriseolus]|uniref:hypothetical protein n=1 Tax=Streptomyces albogriseolus TaxID=1887 RepID=UPI003813ACAD
MSPAERERLELLKATADEIAASLPVWDGEMPAVLVNIVDPVTLQLLGHRFVTADRLPGRKHLWLIGEAS